MRCPSLKELPTPPVGKNSWPWTEESSRFSDVAPSGLPWPRISIVTPSYNQAEFLEETIRSVLLQGYPNLEYVIIDGGSTDGSVDIIKKYARWLKYWVSDKDEGQSDALNKGFSRSGGEICAFLNSDDMFLPKALERVAFSYVRDGGFKWLASPVFWGESLKNSHIWKPLKATFPIFASTQTVSQEGVFWTVDVLPKPYFDNKKRFCMDHKFFTEIYLKHGPPRITKEITAFFRKHPAAKNWQLTNAHKDEHQRLIDEIIAKVDTKTALNIKKEALFEEAIYKIQGFLNDGSKTIAEKRKGLIEAVKTLIKIPFILRGGTFHPLSIRLRMRGRNIFCLLSRLFKQLIIAGRSKKE